MVYHHPVCRLCLGSVDPQETPLLNINQHLIKSILHVTGIEVVSDPSHYEYLCNLCQSELEQCVKFRTICINNDGIFRKMISEENPNDNHKSDQVECVDIEVKQEEADDLLGDQSDPVPEDPIDSNTDDENDTEFKNDPQPVEVPEEPPIKKKRSSKTDDTGPKVKKNPRKAQCQQCGAMVAYYNLKIHLEIHNPNRQKLTCPQCPQEFICPKRLKVHINAIHTQANKFTCDQCGKEYLRQTSLRAHYLASHCEKMFECELCGERFSRAALKCHHQRKVHSTARPFACEHCYKTFKFKSDLVIHTRKHTGERPFKCDICGKGFSKSYNVVIHKKTHQKNKNMPSAEVEPNSSIPVESGFFDLDSIERRMD